MHVLCSFTHPDACIWEAGTIRFTVGRKEMNECAEYETASCLSVLLLNKFGTLSLIQ
jgi:hypothetical protein